MSVSPIKLAAGAGAAVFSMVIGSFFGDSGTLIGAATGSVAYGVAAEGFEYAGRKAHHAARRTVNWRDGNHPLAERVLDQPGGAEALARAENRRNRRLTRPWMLAGSGLAIAAASTGSALAVMSATEAATGKTFHGAVTGSADYGSTLAHSTTPPSARPSIAPSDASPSPSITQTPTTILSPTMVPTVVASPTITVVPATPSRTAATTPPSSSDMSPVRMPTAPVRMTP